MTLRHMQIFRTLCENDCNTTKAAQALHMTQPAVSLAIKELEQHYNVILFDRIGRRLSITEAGKKLEEYCRSIENLFDDMEKELGNWDKEGVIRVGGTLTIGARFLPRYVKAFREIYSGIEVKGVCAPANVLENKVLNNELDFALSEGIAKDAMIVSEPYMDDKLVAFAPADGGYKAGDTISLEQFSSEKLVLREQGSGTRKVFDYACEKAEIRFEPVWESMSTSGVISAVIHGIGIGVLSEKLVDNAIKNGTVVPLYVEDLDLNRKFYIIRHKDKKLSPTAQKFIELCSSTNFSKK